MFRRKYCSTGSSVQRGSHTEHWPPASMEDLKAVHHIHKISQQRERVHHLLEEDYSPSAGDVLAIYLNLPSPFENRPLLTRTARLLSSPTICLSHFLVSSTDDRQPSKQQFLHARTLTHCICNAYPLCSGYNLQINCTWQGKFNINDFLIMDGKTFQS